MFIATKPRASHILNAACAALAVAAGRIGGVLAGCAIAAAPCSHSMAAINTFGQKSVDVMQYGFGVGAACIVRPPMRDGIRREARCVSSGMHSLRKALAGVLCGIAVTTAKAHDTWFEPLPATTATGGVAFALGTGNRFPVQEFPLYGEHLAGTGCRSAAGEVVPLRPLQDRPNAIWLRAAVKPAAQPSCWAQVLPVEITLGADIVELYLKEVNAPASVREAWAGQRARGAPWKERYAKHARVEVLRPGAAVATQPVPMAMDVLLSADGPVAVDRTLIFQVLRDGQPLAGLAVELQNHTTPIGFWRLTDADGRVSFAPPLPGRWLLRGTELRPAPAQPDVWESRFITLAFEVPPPSGR